MKITKERLRQIITEELKLEALGATGESEDEIIDNLLNTHDGPVNRFGVIYRALEFVKNGNDVDKVANALYKSLDIIGDDELPSTEY